MNKKIKFNKYIKEKLLKNKYIIKVTDNHIVYSNKFKILLWNNFNKGISPKETFKNNNLDLNIIGEENPRRLLSRIRKEVEKEDNKKLKIEEIFKNNKKEKRGRKKKILPKNWLEEVDKLPTDKDKIEYLEAKVALFEEERKLFPNLRKEVKLSKTNKFKVIKNVYKNSKKKIKLIWLLRYYRLSKSGYYSFLKNNPIREEKDLNDLKLIKYIYQEGKKKLGYRSITMKLRDNYSIYWNHKKVKRLMELNNLKAIIRKKKYKKPYEGMKEKTEEEKKNVFPNILNQNFKSLKTVYSFYSTDITYFFYLDEYNQEHTIYLSVLKDIVSRKIVAWNISESIDLKLVLDMMNKFKDWVKDNKIDLSNVLIHSDQGVHYTSKIYSNLLKNLKITQSMSRKGNSYDNAVIESFFGHMKDYVDERGLSKDVLLKEMNNYLESYNDRKQWDLNKLSPNEYALKLLSE